MSKLGFNNASKKSDLKLRFDPTEYVQYLDGMDVSDEDAAEILRALWEIMVQFVDLGFDVDFNTAIASQKLCHQAAPTDSDNNKIEMGDNNHDRT